MNHPFPLLALAGFFAVAGLALFAMTLREPKAPSSAAPQKKSGLRELAARQQELVKMRVGGAVLVLVGAILMFLF
jgi:hypothetical protein